MSRRIESPIIPDLRYSLYCAEFELPRAQAAPDGLHFAEHSGDGEMVQWTTRCRVELIPSLRPWATSDYVRVLAEAARALGGAK